MGLGLLLFFFPSRLLLMLYFNFFSSELYSVLSVLSFCFFIIPISSHRLCIDILSDRFLATPFFYILGLSPGRRSPVKCLAFESKASTIIYRALHKFIKKDPAVKCNE